MLWKRGAISTPWKCGKGSYAVEVRRVVLSWLAALNTTKDSYALKAEKFQHRGSVEGCTGLVGRIKYHKRIPTPLVWKVVPSWLGAASTINWLPQVA